MIEKIGYTADVVVCKLLGKSFTKIQKKRVEVFRV